MSVRMRRTVLYSFVSRKSKHYYSLIIPIHCSPKNKPSRLCPWRTYSYLSRKITWQPASALYCLPWTCTTLCTSSPVEEADSSSGTDSYHLLIFSCGGSRLTYHPSLDVLCLLVYHFTGDRSLDDKSTQKEATKIIVQLSRMSVFRVLLTCGDLWWVLGFLAIL